jgi:hypothetical protein
MRAEASVVGRAALLALLLGACGGGSPPLPSPSPTPTPSFCTSPPSAYAQAVTEWWLPNCDATRNIYKDPNEALGPPNYGGFGPDSYTGFVSLGMGGFVTVDFGGCVEDRPGNDIRVYQAVSREPVSVYVAEAPSGPYTLLAYRVSCPDRRGCEFDLAAAGVPRARYVKVQDGELYPCPNDSTSAGADIDAVQAISVPVSRADPPQG